MGRRVQILGSKPYERGEELKYLGANLTKQNYIQEEIKSRLKSGKACYHSFGAEYFVFQFVFHKYKD